MIVAPCAIMLSMVVAAVSSSGMLYASSTSTSGNSSRSASTPW